jgi:putative DNA primase/helicase
MGIDFARVDWLTKLAAVGIDRNCLRKKAGPCPLCYDGKHGAHRFRFDNKGGLGTWFCQQCGAGNGYTLIQRYTGKSSMEILQLLDDASSRGSDVGAPIKRFTFEDADFSPEQVAKNRKQLSKVSAGCMLLTGNDPVSVYLRNRVPGCDLTKISSDIMFHPGLKFYEEEEGGRYVSRGTFPTMVARAIDGAERPITLHRTYLTTAGKKAPFDDVKKQMKGIRKLDGAAIRLVNVPESRVLGLTEGIETGVAVATGYRYRINVWSLLNCVNLALTDIPEGRFDEIIIFADHDRIDMKNGFRPGEHYATLLKTRLEEKGFKVTIKLPQDEGTDFADVWLAIQQQALAQVVQPHQPQAQPQPVPQPRPMIRPPTRPHAESQQLCEA